jgi:hypothetical protein
MDMYLFEDHLHNGQTASFGDTVARAIYVTGGSISVGDKTYAYDDGLVVTGAVTVTAGDEGASLWRWDLSDAAPVDAPAHSALKLSGAVPEHLEVAGNFMRLDSVTFPPSGTAMLHTHQGPGIRCLREGSIRIDTEGHSTAFGPGGAWHEAGPQPVFAQADHEVQSRFIRAMVLPEPLRGKSSIHYVNEEDRDKPKSQSYRNFGEIGLAL